MEKIRKFIRELDHFILEKEDFNTANIALMGGVSGVIYYCFHSSNTQLHEKGYQLLDELIEEITNKEVLQFTYADGMCGILYLLNFLKENGWIEDALDDFIYPYEQFIVNSIIPRDISVDNKDFLYGILGYLHYFVSKDITPYNQEIITNIIEYLEKTAINEKDSLFLTNKFYNKGKVVFEPSELENQPTSDIINFGIAHGNLAFGIILLDVIEKYPHLNGLNSLVYKLSRLYMNNFYQENLQKKISLFPNLKLGDQSIFNAIPLSWCYGDLSIAIFFIRLFKLTKNSEHYQIALRIVEGYRDSDMEIDDNINPYYCHGYVGFLAQFKTIFELNQDEQFNFEEKEKKIIAIISQQLGKEMDLHSYLENNLDLLNGVLSIPLMFNSINTEWRKIFLN